MMIKMAMIGTIGALMAAIMKQFRKEYSILILLAAVLLLAASLISDLESILHFIQSLSQKMNLSDSYLRLLFKLLSISFIARLSSGLCEDMGYRSISFQLEMLGKLSILLLSIPVLSTILDMIDDFL